MSQLKNKTNILTPQRQPYTLNLFGFDKAGVYKIICTATHKMYYGQTGCFLHRWTNHFYHLKRHTHECLSLQKDFDNYGPEKFCFEIVILKTYSKTRRKIEQNFIKKTLLQNLYNVVKPHNFTKKATCPNHRIKINNQIYVSEAGRQLNLAVRTIRKRLDDKTNLNYKLLEVFPVTYFDHYAVLINGKYFNFTREVVNANLANHKFASVVDLKNGKIGI